MPPSLVDPRFASPRFDKDLHANPWSVVVGLIVGVLAFHAKLEFRRMLGLCTLREAKAARGG